MGYDLHITRRKRWPDKGNDVSDKMVAIARHFGATVQGDDGEIYDGEVRRRGCRRCRSDNASPDGSRGCAHSADLVSKSARDDAAG